jgi:hypothetical protein
LLARAVVAIAIARRWSHDRGLRCAIFLVGSRR